MTVLSLNPAWLPNLFRSQPIHQERLDSTGYEGVATDNGTAHITMRSTRAALQAIAAAFSCARQIDLEAGFDNEFRWRLLSAVQQHGALAIEAIESQMSRVDPDTVAMALRYLGDMPHPTTYRLRFNLLIDSLFHPASQIRDGAGLGLALLEEREAIPYLQRAIQIEPIPSLRADLQMVLDQLVH
jgi:hypothetical protein